MFFCFEKDIIYYDFFWYIFVNDFVGYFYVDFWFWVVFCEGIWDSCVNYVIFVIGVFF